MQLYDLCDLRTVEDHNTSKFSAALNNKVNHFRKGTLGKYTFSCPAQPWDTVRDYFKL